MRISDWSSDVCSSDLALQRVVARIAGGAEKLQGIVGHLDRHLGGEDLRLRGLQHVGKAGSAVGSLMDEGAGGGELRRHVGQHPLQALELADRPAELLAPAAVGQRLLVGALRSEEHTSELQSLMRNSYAVFC